MFFTKFSEDQQFTGCKVSHKFYWFIKYPFLQKTHFPLLSVAKQLESD